MHFEANNIYHLYNRTFNHTLAFPTRRNYLYFRGKLNSLRAICDILCYCIMPDHFELVVHVPATSLGLAMTPDGQMQVLSRRIGKVLASYARAYNRQKGRRGSLFQPKTKSKSITSGLDLCIDRIHSKPTNAGLVFHAADWEFSSLSEYKRGVPGLCHLPLASSLGLS